jgi:putative membrane protein
MSISEQRSSTTEGKAVVLWLAIFFSVLLWSAFRPHDYFTWFMEVLPALVAVVVLGASYARFRLSALAYWLILVHAVILMIGGHYTYAEVPLFDWVRDVFHQGRNNYDKVGHFAQGFVPAIIARELLLRKLPLRPGAWLSFITVSICLAISALYELFEWAVAEATGEASEAFLGTQGYQWDTQSDMAFALLGAVLAVVLLGRYHDVQISRIDQGRGAR